MHYLPYLSVFVIFISAGLAITICYMAIQISKRKYALSKIWLFLASSAGYTTGYLILNIFHILPFEGYAKTEFSQLALVLGLAAAANLLLSLLGYLGKLPGQHVRHLLPLKTLSFMIFLQFLVISTIAWTFILLPQIENLVLDENVRRVNLIAHYRANAITHYHHSALTHLRLASHQPLVLECLTQLSQTSCDKSAVLAYLASDSILGSSFPQYLLWSKSSQLIVASNPNDQNFNADLLSANLGMPFVWITNSDRPYAYLNIPVIQDNLLLGYLSAQWNLTQMRNYLEEPIGPLFTDEYHLINSSGQPILSTANSFINNQNSQECLVDLTEVEEHGLQEYVNKPDHKDYYEYSNAQSEQVIASHAYLPALESCLLVEVSQREVLQLPQTNILRSMLITITSVIFLMIVYTLIAGRIWNQDPGMPGTMSNNPKQ